MDQNHKAGFVNIIGRPNAGKSTLMNQMVGERLSIITSKAQTTRHRIMGIINGEGYQIVYSDTPGIIEPRYELHHSMMKFVDDSLEDADIVLLVIDGSRPGESDEKISIILKRLKVPVVLVLNKVDLLGQETVVTVMNELKELYPEVREIVPVSALHNFNSQRVFELIQELLPQSPPFFPKGELTDKPERFFASEIIREKIFMHYKQEIPYSCEVVVTRFKKSEKLIKIAAEIIVEKQSQKGILIGKGGSMLKRVGIDARKDMETFFDKQVFLEQFVKIMPEWRRNRHKLTRFGYM